MARPGPWDTSGTANSLADAINRQAAAQARQAQQKSGLVSTEPEVDPFQQLMDQIQGINVAPTPYEQLLAQATGSAGAQYDPLIKQLEAEMSRTKQRGAANQQEARDMYGALAKDIAAQMPDITNQMAAATKETENRYNQTQQQLKSQYNDQAAEQAALYKQLGIQAATPEASQQAMEDQTYFQNQSQSDEAAALQMLQEMKNADVSYNQQTSNNTRLAGENVAQDIAAQLEDYLQTAGGKLTGLKSGRESTIQAMLAQLQQQDAQRVAQQEETEYDRLMDMFNLQLKMQEMQNDQANRAAQLQRSNQLFKGTNGPSGASNYLSEIYGGGDTFTSSAIMDAINDVMADPAVIAGSYQSDQKDQYGNPIQTKVTDQYMMDLLRRRMSGEGQGPLSGSEFSNMDMNNAINALMAYMGKLK
ncbi:hypothetical protein [Streptomyces rochei]|uniref:hypothetical protein n=1 Tax=Streptomyces rochei TaxID=1928 RepID=UPI00368179C7